MLLNSVFCKISVRCCSYRYVAHLSTSGHSELVESLEQFISGHCRLFVTSAENVDFGQQLKSDITCILGELHNFKDFNASIGQCTHIFPMWDLNEFSSSLGEDSSANV